jgi:hypothetical protein
VNIACSLLCSRESTTYPYFDLAEYTAYLCIHFINIHFIIHLFTPVCSRWYPPFGFWIEILCCFPISPFLML